MEMVYRERWEADIAEMRRVLAGLGKKEECKGRRPAERQIQLVASPDLNPQ